MFIIQLPSPQKAKPLSLEESFKLLQDQEKRQKVGMYTATCIIPTVLDTFFTSHGLVQSCQ